MHCMGPHRGSGIFMKAVGAPKLSLSFINILIFRVRPRTCWHQYQHSYCFFFYWSSIWFRAQCSNVMAMMSQTALEPISEDLESKKYSGEGMPPDPPRWSTLTHALTRALTHLSPPPSNSVLGHCIEAHNQSNQFIKQLSLVWELTQ